MMQGDKNKKKGIGNHEKPVRSITPVTMRSTVEKKLHKESNADDSQYSGRCHTCTVIGILLNCDFFDGIIPKKSPSKAIDPCANFAHFLQPFFPMHSITSFLLKIQWIQAESTITLRQTTFPMLYLSMASWRYPPAT